MAAMVGLDGGDEPKSRSIAHGWWQFSGADRQLREFDQGDADAIDQADTYVHVEFFILVEDEATAPFFDALERACTRGVQVRVLSDHVAQFMYPNRKQAIRRFADMGAEYRPMLPLQPLRGYWRRPDLRNHRKLVVVDGAIGFTGSQNMIIDHYHKKKGIRLGLHWHELMVELTGPVVRELDAVFITDWYSETDELLSLDTSPVRPDDDNSAEWT
jgi:cardiolipin synthase